jgi:predicted deacylase
LSLALGIVLLAAAQAAPLPAESWGPYRLLGTDIPPGEERQLSLFVSESFAGYSLRTPVRVAAGREPGPTLCITAGIHGDELNGTEIVRRVFEGLDPAGVSGILVGIPIVNLHGFRRSSRYLPDRRDLNRYFPGNPSGSAASRIAYAVFDRVIRRCESLVDLHTGSFHRTNLPQLRGDLTNPRVLHLARGFGAGTVVHTLGRRGTLRRAATETGIPAITYEGGEPMRFQDDEVERGVEGIRQLMTDLDMIEPAVDAEGAPEPKPASAPPQKIYHRSRWVRVDEGGILLSRVRLGERIEEGTTLGAVTDPLSNERTVIFSPYAGRLIGMALNQVVIPGFAAFHIGMEDVGPAEAEEEVTAEDLEGDDGPDVQADAIELELDERPE